jgi:polysaccharide pyruvyl transferase WcaK-like protein
VRIHLGHHFYGAGNLGDDFMLAGFLGAMRAIEPDATFTCCVPFPLRPLQQRFPSVDWRPYEDVERARAIERCDLWLGLGGSPFQSALSRWFVDHLVTEAGLCARRQTPMFFLGVGVQTADELAVPDVRRICEQAAGIWTRDAHSAERIRSLSAPPPVESAADLAHLFFRDTPPPPAKPGRVTLVPNFDYGRWPGQDDALRAVQGISPAETIWLAQEARELPGAERALYASLSANERTQWQLVSPEVPGANLADVMTRWPSGEWLLTARFHAALAGAWAGSKVVVLSTNEKLRAAAREFQAPLLPPDAGESSVQAALQSAPALKPPHELADRAHAACVALVRSAVAHRR